MIRSDAKEGLRFTAFDRSFRITDIDQNGVWTIREPTNPPTRGEPIDGERGFFSWYDLDREAKKIS